MVFLCLIFLEKLWSNRWSTKEFDPRNNFSQFRCNTPILHLKSLLTIVPNSMFPYLTFERGSKRTLYDVCFESNVQTLLSHCYQFPIVSHKLFRIFNVDTSSVKPNPSTNKFSFSMSLIETNLNILSGKGSFKLTKTATNLTKIQHRFQMKVIQNQLWANSRGW